MDFAERRRHQPCRGDRALVLAAALIAALASPPTAAQQKKTRSVTEMKATRPPQGPVDRPVSVHSPFEVGECSLCHKRKDPKNPGPVTLVGNKGCFVCHEDFEQLMSNRRFKHPAANKDCTICHNAHNSANKTLLHAPPPTLCFGCHSGIEQLTNSEVKHSAAVTEGKACINCHTTHASNVEHLLTRLAFDQCVQCHDKDDTKDEKGVALTNIKKLLDSNLTHHGPVAQKDCSACHEPHGSKNFRLLIAAYPSSFYAPFDAKTYEMCFGCHEETLATTQKTTTATRFRDGDRNLHFLHVNKPDRGRTCRACHEVHASQKVYQIRESVPFGTKGYLLKVNFEKKADGGNCTQTCHTARSYNNSGAAPTPAKAK
jgi:predicted CXXCH cytochrome family protein